MSPQPHKHTDRTRKASSSDETPVRPRSLFSDDDNDDANASRQIQAACGSASKPRASGEAEHEGDAHAVERSLDDETFHQLLQPPRKNTLKRRPTFVRPAPVDIAHISPSLSRLEIFAKRVRKTVLVTHSVFVFKRI